MITTLLHQKSIWLKSLLCSPSHTEFEGSRLMAFIFPFGPEIYDMDPCY
jgi:hypothetical protein